MSYIPNAREKCVTYPYMREESRRPNGYWHGLNGDYGKAELFGFDEAAQAVNALFGNLEVYADLFGLAFGEGFLGGMGEGNVDGVPPYPLGTEGFEELNEGYRDVGTIGTDEFKRMPEPARMMFLMKHVLNDWLEMRRDEINASLIEGMDQREYDGNYARFEKKIKEGKDA